MNFPVSLLLIASVIATGPAPKQAHSADPIHSWVFDAAHYQKGHFQPVDGVLRAYPRTQPSYRAPAGPEPALGPRGTLVVPLNVFNVRNTL